MDQIINFILHNPEATVAFSALMVTVILSVRQMISSRTKLRISAAVNKQGVIKAEDDLKIEKDASDLKIRELQRELNLKTQESALANADLIRQQVQVAAEINKAMTSNFEIINKNRIDLTARIDKLTDNLNEAIHDRQSDREMYIVKNAELQGELNIFKTSHDSLKAEGRLRDIEIEALKKRQIELESILKTKEDILKGKEDSLTLSNVALKEAQTQLLAEKVTNDELRKTIQGLEKELLDIRSRLGQLENKGE